MESSGVTPRIHDYFEDNEWLYIIMDYVHGVNGQQFLEHRAINKAREIYKLLGIHLARDIHSLKRKESNIDLPIYGLLNVGIDDFDFITSDLKRAVKQNLNISVVGEHSLIHGDYGPHNTILSNESIFIIDWEWAGCGNPLQDVAWVVWFVHLHYPHFSKELSEIFLNAYSGFSDMQITNELVKAYSTSRVINILDRIKYANIDVKNEWVKRLEWTLQTNFI
ncbi:phosphotransferase family protein [Paenibacillus sp. QZ-Y1]|uniref:phosphotransferase family protein n=1 Tax=Paenibacillus sp. QZ-Y1 TaxID=3414511 RepID=UPI003F79461A